GAGTLTVLKSSIPYVAAVTNHRAAFGGLDAETLESAKLRAPEELRTRDRAVTAEDYEFLARKASRRVARVRCIQVQGDGSAGSVPPGTVEMLVLPIIPRETERTLDSLQPPPDLLEEVSTYLDDRRLLGTSLVLDGPSYIGVRVEAAIIPVDGADPDRVLAAVDTGLRDYLDPLIGGSEGKGWPFGRNISLAEVQSLIQGIRGVDFVQDVTLYQVDTETGESRAAGRQVILPEDVLILPYPSSITVADR
ncbi:MAG: putative baseplate assembly protein, partial [Dehalococcoidia bacterium]